MRNTFFNFLHSLEHKEDKHLIESVKSGYDAIYESILMTPLPMARITGLGDEKQTNLRTGKWDIKQNTDNEYFEQTLPDWVQNITDNSYMGSRIGAYPKPSKTHIRPDGDRHQGGDWGGSNGGEYAGSSGGYNLGGPTAAG